MGYILTGINFRRIKGEEVTEMRSMSVKFLLLEFVALLIINSVIGCSHNGEPEVNNSQNNTSTVNSIDNDSLPSSWEDIVVNRVPIYSSAEPPSYQMGRFWYRSCFKMILHYPGGRKSRR